MQFKNPELLYVLFALVIPLLVHLFQLRKFKPTPFTNVAFLKKVKLQTRKSNTIKKWLLLITRMFALAALIIAFAQPYSTQSDTATQEKEMVIYLDNSFSMQARGRNGQLLRDATQGIIAHIPEDQPFTLFTNTEVFKDITLKTHRNDILGISYAPGQLSSQAVALKASTYFTANPATEKRLLCISDFQQRDDQPVSAMKGITTFAIQLTPESIANIAIDSVYVNRTQGTGATLTTLLSTQTARADNVSISLRTDTKLLAKATAAFNDQRKAEVTFDIADASAIRGKLDITDAGLGFDNSLYFSLNTAVPIPVLAINEQDDTFLKKIFTGPEFVYTAAATAQLNYSLIPEQRLIVLNELKAPSAALVSALTSYTNEGGHVVIIPAVDADVNAYKNLTQNLMGSGNIDFSTDSLGIARKGENTSSKITTINYDHPLYQGVFDSRIKNFQFPNVQKRMSYSAGDPLLRYDDGSAFLLQRGTTYLFTAALNTQNSNFKNAPLIVPTFYNMGKQSLKLPELYYTIGRQAQYSIASTIENDATLQLQAVDGSGAFIPLQQRYPSSITLTTETLPATAGNYLVTYEDSALQDVSYNYDRAESILAYHVLENEEGLEVYQSISGLYDDLQQLDEVRSLWKWFIIFALLFLFIEMLILKFFK